MSSLLGARLQQLGHVDRLRVVVNHALHELHVGRRGPDLREIARLFGADDAAGLTGRAGLHDRPGDDWVAGSAGRGQRRA